ncbi:MAG: cyclic beta 1-2 glucan synthetase [Elusimicrobia bacterium HGW-Elusimicrobia-1]|jgi:cellobiose phosphorylase|nr:MAG: cyclic beta 1-2 glucan synthetase [Elusimicrobia bacterium HGW-Elusimicrobia-1]
MPFPFFGHIISTVGPRLGKFLPKKSIAEEHPLRDELFSIDQFEAHAKKLAGKHTVSFKRGREKLLSRLKENERILLRTYELLNEAGKVKRRISPAGEWLLDNYYLIEEQIRLAQKYLPKGYSRELPNLTKGPMAGYPRVYDIAMTMVSHGDGRLDIKGLSGFVSSYQTVKHLKLGELWAIPIMLRLALIENLRRVSSRMMRSQIDRDRAAACADRILEVSAKDANDVILEIASMAKSDLPLSSSFVAEFVRRIHGQSSTLNLPLSWLEKKLSERGENIDRLIQSIGHDLAADQVSMANTIESLRLLEAKDWHDFVEQSSIVEEILRRDPSGDYGLMSFATRDGYRHVIEKLSAQGRLAEEAVAAAVVRLAAEAEISLGRRAAAAHIGYYLIDRGLRQLYRALGLRAPLSVSLQTKNTALPLSAYIGSIVTLSAAVFAAFLFLAQDVLSAPWPRLVLFVIPLFVVAGQAAISVVNWISTILVKPGPLPRMDFSEGIPARAHTLVVVPSMLSGPRGVESLVENMEVHYLANTDANVDFALLTDFCDAPRMTMPDDDALLAQAVAGIEKLNQKYRRLKENIFYLFHRPRIWNDRESVWMGYERKRGKLADLNSLLRGGAKDKFSAIVGDPGRLQDVKYVITLDADTRMPRDVARELAGVIEHPLNRPVYDEKKRRVTAGYGILQPRVEAAYPGGNPSLFVKVYGGESGIDPYTKTVSDVYQDLFGEGSFIGKGLYDVDAFEKSLAGRFPENLILSHDLLEGCYARSALVTDVQLYEEYPAAYLKDASRRHRWIRGDVQIARWIFAKVPAFGGKKVKNPISVLSKWKIFDNLRRTLVPASTAFLLLFGWTFFEPAWFWSLAAIAFMGSPAALAELVKAARKSAEITLNAHLDSMLSSLLSRAGQFCFSLTFVVYEAFYGLDAIAAALWRILVSRRRLLKWKTFNESASSSPKNIFGFYKKMYVPPMIVVSFWAYSALVQKNIDALTAAILGLWALAPAVAYLISRPGSSRKIILSVPQLLFLRSKARRIWDFSETFVTERDNWLPPDNFQEEPLGAVAHRTSPTNIGLSLLSNLAAYDFGYVSMGRMFNRSEKTLGTMDRMEKYRGHFYNWYDTQTLKPLEPLYVSSVDSGNLAGHLLVLRSGLMEMRENKIVHLKIFDGLADTLSVLRECVAQLAKNKTPAQPGLAGVLSEKIDYFRKNLAAPPSSLPEIHALLRRFSKDISKVLSVLPSEDTWKIKKWAQVFERQCYDYLEDMSFIAPWILMPPEIPGMWDKGGENRRRLLARLREELRRLDEIPVLSEVAMLEMKFFSLIDEIRGDIVSSGDDSLRENEWFEQLKNAISAASARSSERITAIDYIVLRASELSAIEYEFLYDKTSYLLSIGYNVGEHKSDSGCYDLLASESRLCSYVAIAQGRLPQKHWFMLGRMLSKYGGPPVLVSWGGSMFEYLMPLLVMPTYEDTLLERTYHAMIGRQIKYASANNIPWGISESGYNKIDAAMTYQYRAFGVPDIGFKRGLSEDLVIAPYAAVMALMVEPAKAYENLRQLNEMGFAGEYGFYEAVDYTPSRLSRDKTRAVVKSYMAHHQGMSFLSLAYVLLDMPMQRRFLSDPMFKATELLLQERVPKEAPLLYDVEVTGSLKKIEEREALLRVFINPDTPSPETHLLSNGTYSVMVTNAGGGYSRWKNIGVTRWREDATSDADGAFIYLRDTITGEFWSAAYQPALKKSDSYEAVFSQSRAEFKRRDNGIDTHTTIAVSPEDDIELRRVKITNTSRSRTRVIEITSYAEAVLNYPAHDAAHRVFGNLFVQTQIIRSHQAIICTRRPRSDSDKFPCMLHLMAVHGNAIVGASYETDRNKFIGRCNTLESPSAMRAKGRLSDSEGSVLDPIVAIRSTVELGPEESAVIDYVTGICETPETARGLMEKYRDRNLADRVFDLAWTRGQVALQQINATEADAQLYGRLASAIIYANPAWRANASVLKANYRGQPDLWGYGISGDLPIVLVRLEDQKNIELAAKMVQAYSYWRLKGLAVDLLIWNEDRSVYRDTMGERINALIAANAEVQSNRPGGIFLRRADQMSDEDKTLFETVARIVVTDRAGTLAEQIESRARLKKSRPPFIPAPKTDRENAQGNIAERPELAYFNGIGGFTRDGREYVITTDRAQRTPAPWVNVLASRDFGTVISESGGAYTWSENAHEFRLTPWKNDPVTDTSGEALYIRDEETGIFWSPTPLPSGGNNRYVTRHGFGYSIFEHVRSGIVSELTVFVSPEHPVKFAVLKIKNISGRKRKLSATSYNELVMGSLRDKYHMHISTEVDPKTGALLARNPYNKEFSGRVVFLNVSETARFVSGDRNEFLGRNGSIRYPAAMRSEKLSGKAGAGLDPCASMQVKFELDDSYQKDIVFAFGSAKSVDEARGLIGRFNGTAAVRKELENVWDYWKRVLGVVYVETPDDSINFLVNGWLQYQTISCRLWGRSGYYQSGGAYGFRDQLQDVTALTHSLPSMTRAQLLSSASRQFIEGDVQHWWHPPAGRGVRSRCSDDYLWLPFAACLYVEEVGDTGVMDEPVNFLEGPAIKSEEESYYGLPKVSEKSGTLYEHCVLAVKRALNFGARGLPLMGSGDWNDGMNLVGRQGKGESVWLAFFLCHILKSMSSLAESRGDKNFAELCAVEVKKLSKNIEDNAWDGRWYTRAYFDNGEVIGSSSNIECRIDSIPQSWAVISGAAPSEKAGAAMDSVDEILVDRKHSLVKLFAPAFDKSPDNPGYIKGYVPGVRENGGQYTHAAVWAAIAFAMLKDKKRAWELLNIINPIHHGDTFDKCEIYKVEPFVAAGDVYSVGSNAGRGGWTWYTGAASWMYRLIVGHLLGLRRAAGRLYFEPCPPEDWQSFKMHYRHGETFYHIAVQRIGPADGVVSVVVDGKESEDKSVRLIDDRKEHFAEVKIG